MCTLNDSLVIAIILVKCFIFNVLSSVFVQNDYHSAVEEIMRVFDDN